MRTTSEKKDDVIKVRVSEEMRTRLETLARRSGMKLSEYIREVLRRHII